MLRRQKLEDIYSDFDYDAPSRRILAPRLPATTKPLSMYTSSDISQLMYDLGVNSVDVSTLRRSLVDGVTIQVRTFSIESLCA